MMSEAYHHPIGIRPDDIDHMGHVNNSVYLKWVQEAVVDSGKKSRRRKLSRSTCGSRSAMKSNIGGRLPR